MSTLPQDQCSSHSGRGPSLRCERYIDHGGRSHLVRVCPMWSVGGRVDSSRFHLTRPGEVVGKRLQLLPKRSRSADHPRSCRSGLEARRRPHHRPRKPRQPPTARQAARDRSNGTPPPRRTGPPPAITSAANPTPPPMTAPSPRSSAHKCRSPTPSPSGISGSHARFQTLFRTAAPPDDHYTWCLPSDV